METDDGKKEDKWLYSFSKRYDRYNLDILIAAICQEDAVCHTFPRTFQSTLKDRSSYY